MDSNHPVSSNPHGAVLLISAPTLETRPRWLVLNGHVCGWRWRRWVEKGGLCGAWLGEVVA